VGPAPLGPVNPRYEVGLRGASLEEQLFSKTFKGFRVLTGGTTKDALIG